MLCCPIIHDAIKGVAQRLNLPIPLLQLLAASIEAQQALHLVNPSLQRHMPLSISPPLHTSGSSCNYVHTLIP